MKSQSSKENELLRAEGLVKRYGNLTAVDNVNFSVNKGDVIAFLGPNGAGKSTTIRMLAGYLKPTEGQVLLEGNPIANDLIHAKSIMGYMPESTPSYPEMTVTEYLQFIAKAYDLSDEKEVVSKVIKLTHLQKVQYQLIETLSKGYRSRVSFAAAIIHDPPILLLDEPTDGLDPNQKNEIRLLIKSLAKDKAIIVSTHILEEVSAMCNRVIVISEGKKVLDGTPSDLERKVEEPSKVVINIDRDQKEKVESAIASQLKIRPGDWNGSAEYWVEPTTDTIEILNRLNKAGILPRAIYSEKPSIDKAFRNITRTTE